MVHAAIHDGRAWPNSTPAPPEFVQIEIVSRPVPLSRNVVGECHLKLFAAVVSFARGLRHAAHYHAILLASRLRRGRERLWASKLLLVRPVLMDAFEAGRIGSILEAEARLAFEAGGRANSNAL